MKEKKITVPIHKSEYEMLKEKLESFNDGLCQESKLTFDEFVFRVFETKLLEEKLNSKYDYLDVLKDEINQLEDELMDKYSMGLTGCEESYDEIIESRKKTLKDSSLYINGFEKN